MNTRCEHNQVPTAVSFGTVRQIVDKYDSCRWRYFRSFSVHINTAYWKPSKKTATRIKHTLVLLERQKIEGTKMSTGVHTSLLSTLHRRAFRYIEAGKIELPILIVCLDGITICVSSADREEERSSNVETLLGMSWDHSVVILVELEKWRLQDQGCAQSLRSTYLLESRSRFKACGYSPYPSEF